MGNKQGIPGHVGERSPRSPDTRARSWSFHGVSGARRKASTLPGHAGTGGASAAVGRDSLLTGQVDIDANDDGMRTRSSSMHERERPPRRRPLFSWDDNDPSLRYRQGREGQGDRDTEAAHIQRLGASGESMDEVSTIQMRPHQRQSHDARPASENRSRRPAVSGGERSPGGVVRRESAPARPQGWQHLDMANPGTGAEPGVSPDADTISDPWTRMSVSKDAELDDKLDTRDHNVEEPASRKELFKDSETQRSGSTWRKKQKDRKNKGKKKSGKLAEEALPQQDIQVLHSSPKRRVSKTESGGVSKPTQEARPESERCRMSSPEPSTPTQGSGVHRSGRSFSPSKWLRLTKSPPQSPSSSDVSHHYSRPPKEIVDRNGGGPDDQQQKNCMATRKDKSDEAPNISSLKPPLKTGPDGYNKDLADLLTSPSNTRRKGKIIISRSQGLVRSNGVTSPCPSSSRAPVTTGEVITLSASISSNAEVSSTSAVPSSSHHRVSSSSSSTSAISASPALLPASRSDSNINPRMSPSARGAGDQEAPASVTGGAVFLRRVGPTRRSGVSNIITTRPGRPSSIHESHSPLSPSTPISPLSHSPLFLYMRRDTAPSSPSTSSPTPPETGHPRRVLVSRPRTRQAPNRLSLDLSQLGSNHQDISSSKGSESNINSSVLSPGPRWEGSRSEQVLPPLHEAANICHSTDHLSHNSGNLAKRGLLLSTTSDQYLDSLGRKKKGVGEERRAQQASSETRVGVGRHEASVTVVDVGPTTTFTPVQHQQRVGRSVEDIQTEHIIPPLSQTPSPFTLPSSHPSSISAGHDTTQLIHSRNSSNEISTPHAYSAHLNSQGSGPAYSPPLVSPDFATTITTTDSGYNTGKRCAAVDLFGSIRPGMTAAVPSPPAGTAAAVTVSLGSVDTASAKITSSQLLSPQQLLTHGLTCALTADTEISQLSTGGKNPTNVALNFSDSDNGGVAKQAVLPLSDAGSDGRGKDIGDASVCWNRTLDDNRDKNTPQPCLSDSSGLARQHRAGNFTDSPVKAAIHQEGLPGHRHNMQQHHYGHKSTGSERIASMDNLWFEDIKAPGLSNHSSYDNLTGGRDKQRGVEERKVYLGPKRKELLSGRQASGFDSPSHRKIFDTENALNMSNCVDKMLYFSDPLVAKNDDVIDDPCKGQAHDRYLPPARSVDGIVSSCLPGESRKVSAIRGSEGRKHGDEEAEGGKGDSLALPNRPGNTGMSSGEGGLQMSREMDGIVKGVGDVTSRLDNGHDGRCGGQDMITSSADCDRGLVKTNARLYAPDGRVGGQSCEQAGGHTVLSGLTGEVSARDQHTTCSYKDTVGPGDTYNSLIPQRATTSVGKGDNLALAVPLCPPVEPITDAQPCECKYTEAESQSLGKESVIYRREARTNVSAARERDKQPTARPWFDFAQQHKPSNLSFQVAESPGADNGPKTVGRDGVKGDSSGYACGLGATPDIVRHATPPDEDRDVDPDGAAGSARDAGSVTGASLEETCWQKLPEDSSIITGGEEFTPEGRNLSSSGVGSRSTSAAVLPDYVNCGGRVDKQQQLHRHQAAQYDYSPCDNSVKFSPTGMLISGLKGGTNELCRADKVSDNKSTLSCGTGRLKPRDGEEFKLSEQCGFKSSEGDNKMKSSISETLSSSSSPPMLSLTPSNETIAATVVEDLANDTRVSLSVSVSSSTRSNPTFLQADGLNRDFSSAESNRFVTDRHPLGAGEREILPQRQRELQQQQQQQQSLHSNNDRNVTGMCTSRGESQVVHCSSPSLPSPSALHGAVSPSSAGRVSPDRAGDKQKSDTSCVQGETQSRSYTINNHALNETHAATSLSGEFSSSVISPPLPLSSFLFSPARNEGPGGGEVRAARTSGASISASGRYDDSKLGDRSASDAGTDSLSSPTASASRYTVASPAADSGYYGDGPPASAHAESRPTRSSDSSPGVARTEQAVSRSSRQGKIGEENLRAISRDHSAILHEEGSLDYVPQVRDKENVSRWMSARDEKISTPGLVSVSSRKHVDDSSVSEESSRHFKHSRESSDASKVAVATSPQHAISLSHSVAADKIVSSNNAVRSTQSRSVNSSHVPVASSSSPITTSVTGNKSSDSASNSSRPRVLEVTNPSYETDSLDRRESASKLREVAKKLLAGHAALSGRLSSTLGRQQKKEQTSPQQQKKKRQKNQQQQQQPGKKSSLTLFTPLGKFGRKKSSPGVGNSSTLAATGSPGAGKGLSRELSGSEGSLGDLSRRRGAASQYRDLSLSENSVLDAVNDENDDEDEWFFFPGSTKDRKGAAGRRFPFEPSDDFAANVKSIYSQGEKSMYSASESPLTNTDLAYPLDVVRSYAAGVFQDQASPELIPISPNTSTPVIDFSRTSQDISGGVKQRSDGRDLMSQSYCGPISGEDRPVADGIETLFQGKDDDVDFSAVEMRPRTNSATAIELGTRTPGRIAMGMASARIRRSYASPVKENYHLPARPASHSLASPGVQAKAPVLDVNKHSHLKDSPAGKNEAPSQSATANQGLKSPLAARHSLLHHSSPSQAHRHQASSPACSTHVSKILPDETANLHRLQQPLTSASQGSSTPSPKPLASRAFDSNSSSDQATRAGPQHENVWELRPEFQPKDRTEETGPQSLDENLLACTGISRSIDIPVSGRNFSSRGDPELVDAISPMQGDGRVSPPGDQGFFLQSRDWNIPRQRHSLDSGQRYLSQSAEFSHHYNRRPTFHGSSSFYPGLHHYHPRHYQHQQEQFLGYDPHRLSPDEEQSFPSPHSGYPYRSYISEASNSSGYQLPDGAPQRLIPSSLHGPHLYALSPMSRASISLAPLPEEHNLSSIHGDSLSDLRYGSSTSLALSTSVPADSGFPHRRYKVVPNYPADPGRPFPGSANIWAGERWLHPGPQSHLRHQRSSSIHSIPTLENRRPQHPADQAMYSYDDSSVSRAGHHYTNYDLHRLQHSSEYHVPGFRAEGGPALDVRARSRSLVTAHSSDIAARVGGFTSGRCLNPFDRAWSYSVTSLMESGSGLLSSGEFSTRNLCY